MRTADDGSYFCRPLSLSAYLLVARRGPALLAASSLAFSCRPFRVAVLCLSRRRSYPGCSLARPLASIEYRSKSQNQKYRIILNSYSSNCMRLRLSIYFSFKAKRACAAA